VIVFFAALGIVTLIAKYNLFHTKGMTCAQLLTCRVRTGAICIYGKWSLL